MKLGAIFNRILQRSNRQIVRCSDWKEYQAAHEREVFQVEAMLERVSNRLKIASVVDVGASNGCWSRRCMTYYPDAHYVLIEAQEQAHGDDLRSFAAVHPQCTPVFAAAGDHQGTIHFNTTDARGGLARETPFAPDVDREVPLTTVDHAVREACAPGPYLLKIDTHGYELPILAGATHVLSQCELIVMEVYNFTIAENMLRFAEMATHMETLDFRVLDIIDVLRRPDDGVLWQMDLVFARADRPEFSSSTYRSF